ncbi:MAG: helix-turn-helix transcriptional regulator [Pseudomonadota bacterium]
MPQPTGQTVSPKRQSFGDWSRLAKTYAAGTVVAPHAHSAGQLLFITQGVLLVETEHARWTVPPQQSLWLPPGQQHGFYAASETVLRGLYFGAPWMTDAQARFPHAHEVHAIAVAPLLRELVLGLFESQFDTATQRSMLDLVLKVLPRMANLPTNLPLPSDTRLRQAAMAVLTERAWGQPLHMTAALAHMSERSFTRNFKSNVGLTYRSWRQRARLIVSLDLLNAEHSVKHIAHVLGFASSAAYVSAFGQLFGSPPGAFVSGKEG